jgi:hypothetical protein
MVEKQGLLTVSSDYEHARSSVHPSDFAAKAATDLSRAFPRSLHSSRPSGILNVGKRRAESIWRGGRPIKKPLPSCTNNQLFFPGAIAHPQRRRILRDKDLTFREVKLPRCRLRGSFHPYGKLTTHVRSL